MKTALPEDSIRNMILRSRKAFKDKGTEMTEDMLKEGMSTRQPCGHTPLDQMWGQESLEIRSSMNRADYDEQMTEYILELFRALPPAA